MIPKQLKNSYLDLYPAIAVGSMHADDNVLSLSGSKGGGFTLSSGSSGKATGKNSPSLSSSLHDPDSEADFRRIDIIMKKEVQKHAS